MTMYENGFNTSDYTSSILNNKTRVKPRSHVKYISRDLC